jgi:hypothetical protein
MPDMDDLDGPVLGQTIKNFVTVAADYPDTNARNRGFDGAVRIPLDLFDRRIDRALDASRAG